MSEEPIVHVKPGFAAASRVNGSRLGLMTNHAMNDPDGFWLEQATRLDWINFPTLASNSRFGGGKQAAGRGRRTDLVVLRRQSQRLGELSRPASGG